jgi:hypothetical protein
VTPFGCFNTSRGVLSERVRRFHCPDGYACFASGTFSLSERQSEETGASDTHRVGWGVAEAPQRGAGDRGAHHMGDCVPSSVVENRAPPHVACLTCGACLAAALDGVISI